MAGGKLKFSTDPALEAKVRDVTGLYLNPPDKAMVLCVDEKPQTQALNRTPPVLPVHPGSGNGDARLHAARDHHLFAALEAATGKVTGACYPRHGKANSCLPHAVARAYPRPQVAHGLDNYRTHTHPDVQAWLDKHPRITLHFTPTSGSWLNLVEVFFSIITRQAIRRGSFTASKTSSRRSRRSSTGRTNAATRSSGPRPPTRYSRNAARVKGPRSHDTSSHQDRNQYMSEYAIERISVHTHNALISARE